jgi:hypothetical protein
MENLPKRISSSGQTGCGTPLTDGLLRDLRLDSDYCLGGTLSAGQALVF